MIQNIRRSFNSLLDKVEWMDDATREVAREKVTENIYFYQLYIINKYYLFVKW